MVSVDCKSYKVAICGAEATGKSSLCARLTDREINLEYIRTIGVDLMVKYLPEHKAKIHFWDLSGEKRFESITHNYVKEAKLLIFVYNLEDVETIRRLTEINDTLKNIIRLLPAVVVGTHRDKKFANCEKMGMLFAKERGYPHYTVELKKIEGVKEVMDEIVKLLLPKIPKVDHVEKTRESCSRSNCAIM
jgi:small GTP-binding protein